MQFINSSVLRESTAREARFSFWLLPQLLSLDAVAVSLLWQALFSQSAGISCPFSVFVTSAGAVWLIYISDHVMDLRGQGWTSRTVRHGFVKNHLREISIAMAMVFVLSASAAAKLPGAIFHAGAILSLFVILYGATTHLGLPEKVLWPKELVIAVLFAAGSTISTWSVGGMRPLYPFAILTGLFWLNCAGLDYWQWERDKQSPSPHRSTIWVGRHFFKLSLILASLTAIFALKSGETRISVAIVFSVFLLCTLSSNRNRFTADTVRLLGDAALFTPLLPLIGKAILH